MVASANNSRSSSVENIIAQNNNSSVRNRRQPSPTASTTSSSANAKVANVPLTGNIVSKKATTTISRNHNSSNMSGCLTDAPTTTEDIRYVPRKKIVSSTNNNTPSKGNMKF